jgi:hypothetical protein
LVGLINPPPGTPPPAVIIEHELSNVPAPPVHDYDYYGKMCNVHIYITMLAANHLAQHKHLETKDWTCTTCGKQYLNGRWGYGLLMIHLQGRGVNECEGLAGKRPPA